MSIVSRIEPADVVGRAPERLTIEERQALAGKFVAIEMYSTRTLPLRRIEAIGDSAGECIRQLTGLGLDPRNYEFLRIMPLS